MGVLFIIKFQSATEYLSFQTNTDSNILTQHNNLFKQKPTLPLPNYKYCVCVFFPFIAKYREGRLPVSLSTFFFFKTWLRLLEIVFTL